MRDAPTTKAPPARTLHAQCCLSITSPGLLAVQVFHTFALPRPSEYDLYYSFVMRGGEGGGVNRELAWSDFGACCRDGPGNSLEATEADVEAAAGTTGGRPTCDSEHMHGGLAVHFDFIACHRHMRDRNDRMENRTGEWSGNIGKEY